MGGLTGKLIGKPLTAGHTNGVSDLRFRPAGKTIASGGEDGTGRLWDAAAGKLIAKFFAGHSQPVSDVAFSLDGNAIA